MIPAEQAEVAGQLPVAGKIEQRTAGTLAGIKLALVGVPTGRSESWKYWLLTLLPVRLTLKRPSWRKVIPYLAVTCGANAGRLPTRLARLLLVNLASSRLTLPNAVRWRPSLRAGQES